MYPPASWPKPGQSAQGASPNRARETLILLVFDGNVKFGQSEIVDAGRIGTAESGLFFNFLEIYHE